MHDNALIFARAGFHRRVLHANSTLRAALAMGCATLALVGCGGGSNDTAPVPPPASTLAAPTNFAVDNVGTFRWSATPGATRYELHVDPDGAGPLPETKADDFNQASGTGFSYAQVGNAGFMGTLYATVNAASLNSSYRVRACDASGCGAFSESKAYDLVNAISHEFASGRVPVKFSNGLDGNPRLSKDGLTLAIRAPGTTADSAVNIFTRSSSTDLWQLHAQLRSGKSYFGQQVALSADGSTLAVRALEPSSSDVNHFQGVVYVYGRSGTGWNQQAFFAPPSVPSGCTQPCRADITDHLALSADGNLLAASVSYSTPAGAGSLSIGAVVTYTRTGATWAQQAYLETGGRYVASLALAGDGKTLAVNEGVLDAHDDTPFSATTPFVRIFAQQGDGTWSQQARTPSGIVQTVDITGSRYSTMALSSDGSTLAVHALNVPGHQTPELDLKPADLSCGGLAADGWDIALYTRNGSTWQRQTAISRGLTGNWALASDGNALFYGNALFTRTSGAWTCP